MTHNTTILLVALGSNVLTFAAGFVLGCRRARAGW